MTVEILEYCDDSGASPFDKWFSQLDARAAAKVTTAIDRMGRGLMTNIEPVGGGVSERKINFGPGYRIYFGSESDGRTTRIIILLTGGSKTGQNKDIRLATQYWNDYKARKRKGGK